MPAAEHMREETRNLRLRRSDWRFLLATGAPRRSICFTEGLLAEATAAVSEECLRTADIASEVDVCDLAVVRNPSAATLRNAWTILQPGGAVYLEWHGVWSGGPAGIRRRLAAAGFEQVACYAARPGPTGRVEMWVPLDCDGAVQYYLTRRSTRGPVVRRLLRRIGEAMWRASAKLRMGVPLCAVARKPLTLPTRPRSWTRRAAHEPVVRGLSSQLQDELLSNWDSWGLGDRPGELSALLMTRGKRSINKTVALVFAGSDRHPLLALKRARVPESMAAMWNEAEVLRAVHSRPGGMLGAPRVLFCRELDGFLTLAETVVEGRPVTEVLTQENCRELALRAAAWSAELAQSDHPISPDAWWGRLVEPVLEHFERDFRAVLDRVALRDAIAILSSLGPLPLVIEQRDYSPWNLLLAPNGDLGVLDWESGERRGLPGLDLIYCLTYFSAYVEGVRAHGLSQAWRRCLEPRSEMGSIAQDALERYFAKVGVSPEALRPLALLAWMIHARSEYKEFCQDLGQSPDAAVLQRSVFLQLWYEELGRRARA
jgi:hypothetical protein